MKVYVALLVALLALAAPAQALLGAKLALLGALKSGIGGSIGGYGNHGGYNGGYGNGGGYLGGYGNGGGYNGGYNYNRPVYTGYSSNNGWGQQSYGYGGGYGSYGSYNGGYAGRYIGGQEQIIKVIKVIEEPQVNFENYATGSSAAAGVSTYSSSGPVYVSRPIQYTVQQPIYQQPQPLPEVKTVNVVVDGQSQHVPAQTYGPPQPAPHYVAPYAGNNGAWNSGSWSNANSNVGSWKKGGIWESIGC